MNETSDEELLQIKALGKEGSYDALRQFASTLTTKAKDLEIKEQNLEIMPGQATQILTSMIENFVHAAIRTGVNQEYNRHDVIPNHLVEQRCLEVEIKLLQKQEDEYVTALKDASPETKYVFQPIIASVRNAKEKRQRQLTNLQNKEEK